MFYLWLFEYHGYCLKIETRIQLNVIISGVICNDEANIGSHYLGECLRKQLY